MESKLGLRRPEGREDNEAENKFDALERAARDPSLRYGSFWANAFRDISVEGSSSEERFRARARRAEQARKNRYEFVEPTAIQLPSFSEPSLETRAEVASTANAVLDAKETARETYERPSAPSEDFDQASEFRTVDERPTFYATLARAFSRRTAKERAREDDEVVERYKTRAQRILDVGKALLLAAFFFLAATMIVALFSGD